MANLPAPGYLANAGRTTGEQKQALEDMRDFIAHIIGGNAEFTLTIAAGVVTPGSEDSNRAKGAYSIDTEASAPTDDLTNIAVTNYPSGSILLIRCASASRAVIVKHAAGGSGQISTRAGADI